MKKIITLLLAVSLMAGIVPANAAQNELNPDTSSWFAYEFPKAADVAGTALDASNLLDAPAGKHGFLTGTDGHRFVFEDGTDIRFNGVNVSLALPYADYEHSKEMAARIAQSGYNIVRFHLVESGYRESIWGRKSDGGRMLKDDIMDRMCFFMSELKKRGVYYLLDLTISAPPVADQRFEELSNLVDLNDGFKKYSYFNEELKQITKEIAAEMLNFYNPYTGLRIKDDPALALIDTKNEDFINTNIASSQFGSKHYEAELQAKFNEWLKTKYASDSELSTAWARCMEPNKTAGRGLQSGESMASGTVRIFHDDLEFWDFTALSEGRRVDSAQFLDEVQKAYFEEMIDYLRNDLGVKCRITGVTAFTNTGRPTQILYSNLETDFIDHHSYTALGSSHDFKDGTTMDSPEIAQMADAGYGIIGESFAYNVYGLPHTITEWNHSAVDRYRSESMVLMPAFASLNGMHPFAFCWACGIDQQDYANITTNSFVKTMLGFGENPENLAGLPNAARMFVRQDVSESEKGFYPIRFVGKDPYIYDQKMTGDDDAYKLMKQIGLVGKTGLVFDEAYNGPTGEHPLNDSEAIYQAKVGASSGKFLSTTGEILSDTTNNIVKINTPKTQAVTGRISGQTIELSDIKVTIDNPFATVSYSAVENKPLYQSSSNLLTVLGESRNTGAVYDNSSGNIVMTTAGTGPVLVEPITGTVVIKTNNNITVYPLTSSGKRGAAKAVTSVSGGKQFTMSASDKAMNYEIVIDNAASATQIAPISLGSTTMPALYTDIASNQYKKEIENVMMYTGVWTGTGSAFNPTNNVTKKDFCIWLINALRLKLSDRAITQTMDVDDISSGSAGYAELAIAKALGAITTTTSGSWFWEKTNINPDANLTVTEAKGIVNTILGRSYRGKTNYVTLADSTATLTRAQAAKMVYDVMWQK